jgi:hypothetical protein
MAQFEDNTHVFIVRLWLEPREIEGETNEWRGVIEYVPSGERRYFRDLNDIVDFARPYLEGMGVKFGIYQRISRWIKQRKPFLKTQD